MSVRLNFVIEWSEHEELQATMPMVFQRNFGKKVAVIIECFEIFIERPSSVIVTAMTWSNDKHHNTVKFLIGVTPQGVISFISEAWGGRVNDKYLTENSGLLRRLLSGDCLLADTVEPRLSGPRLSGLFDYPDFFSGPVFFHEY